VVVQYKAAALVCCETDTLSQEVFTLSLRTAHCPVDTQHTALCKQRKGTHTKEPCVYTKVNTQKLDTWTVDRETMDTHRQWTHGAVCQLSTYGHWTWTVDRVDTWTVDTESTQQVHTQTVHAASAKTCH